MKINYRQMCIMLFLSFIALKFLVLPSVLYINSANASWFVVLVLMIIDGIYALLLINLMKKNQNKNINEFMKETPESFFNSQIYLYVIQLGAILAIVTLYFHKLNPFSRLDVGF